MAEEKPLEIVPYGPFVSWALENVLPVPVVFVDDAVVVVEPQGLAEALAAHCLDFVPLQ